jgi:hypothetical protein
MIDQAIDSCVEVRQQLDGLRDMIRRGGLKNMSRREVVRQYTAALDAMVKGLGKMEAALRMAGADGAGGGADEGLPI